MNFNSEELKFIEAERKEILNDILEELQTKSLRELFLETSEKEREKERRIEEVRAILEELSDELRYYERMLRYYERMLRYNGRRQGYWREEGDEKSHERYKRWMTDVLEIIKEIEDDYLNYIHGGEAYISGYLSDWDDDI